MAMPSSCARTRSSPWRPMRFRQDACTSTRAARSPTSAKSRSAIASSWRRQECWSASASWITRAAKWCAGRSFSARASRDWTTRASPRPGRRRSTRSRSWGRHSVPITAWSKRPSAAPCGPRGRRAWRSGRWCSPSSWRCDMPSFDIVSKVNEQEVDNAFQQAKKEIDQRYDFKGTETSLEKVSAPEKGLKIRSTTEQRLEAARTVLVEKMAKRGVPLRGLKYGALEQSGKHVSQVLSFVQGIETEKAKAIVKAIKDSKLKIQGSIQGDTVRVSGKSRDDLQSTIQLVRGKQDELKLDLMFENFRD